MIPMAWVYWTLFFVAVIATALSLKYEGKNNKEVKNLSEKFNQNGSINENWLAEEITKREAGKIEVNIAQIKDVLNAALEILAEEYSLDQVDKLLIKHTK